MASSSSSSSIPSQGGASGGGGDKNPPQQPPKTENPPPQGPLPFPTEMLPDVCRFMTVEDLWKLADVCSEWRTIVLPFIMERMSVDGAAGGGP
ncbi:hypothetical protein Ocin01_09218 [Orchesella cincta]|uniref:F-box domain-containing protein n=1 Tax=Orchesella cincta TaxID=48709 RepID=A0A1D2MWM8_ORCCI|nr:hypothetical protein Ocin01_09218 [Orchesella cincta]